MNELRVTADGSHTLFSTEYNQTYHSQHGAIAESRHVFIKNGLGLLDQLIDQINVFELSMGTGLNVLLAAKWARENNRKINFTTIEPFPISEDQWKALNFSDPEHLLEIIHNDKWGQLINLNSEFNLEKYKVGFEDFDTDKKFHCVFFDAFSPDSQPELWTVKVFEKMASHMLAGSLLTTYCAKGQVKRNLKEAGFEVIALPGPPGKREMINAIKK